MNAGTTELRNIVTADRPVLGEVLARTGTTAVLLAGSQDPNAKVTVVLLDGYGPSFVVKIPTTQEAEAVVRAEGCTLNALATLPLGSMGMTLPRPVGFVTHEGRAALVTTALLGAPMSVAYHGWHHTSRRRNVRRDFAAAEIWLNDLQTRTGGARSRISLFSEISERLSRRFAQHHEFPAIERVLSASASRLAPHTTPRTVVHGDFWFGNLLMRGDRLNGVVDWECAAMAGEPLRDVARFAISYALYLDRHTRSRQRVHGHRGLRADAWGAGVTHMLSGQGWFSAIVQNYLTLALGRLAVPTHLWRDVLIGGIADVAASADHPEFATKHLELLARFTTPTTSRGVRPDGRGTHNDVPAEEHSGAAAVLQAVESSPADAQAAV